MHWGLRYYTVAAPDVRGLNLYTLNRHTLLLYIKGGVQLPRRESYGCTALGKRSAEGRRVRLHVAHSLLEHLLARVQSCNARGFSHWAGYTHTAMSLPRACELCDMPAKGASWTSFFLCRMGRHKAFLSAACAAPQVPQSRTNEVACTKYSIVNRGSEGCRARCLCSQCCGSAACGGIATHFSAAHGPAGRQPSKGSLTAGRLPASLGKAVLHGHGCLHRVQRVGQAVWQLHWEAAVMS